MTSLAPQGTERSDCKAGSLYVCREHERHKDKLHSPYSSGKWWQRLVVWAAEGSGNWDTYMESKKKKKKSQWDKYILEKEHTRLYLSLTILYFSVFSWLELFGRGRTSHKICTFPSKATLSQLYTRSTWKPPKIVFSFLNLSWWLTKEIQRIRDQTFSKWDADVYFTLSLCLAYIMKKANGSLDLTLVTNSVLHWKHLPCRCSIKMPYF